MSIKKSSGSNSPNRRTSIASKPSKTTKKGQNTSRIDQKKLGTTDNNGSYTVNKKSSGVIITNIHYYRFLEQQSLISTPQEMTSNLLTMKYPNIAIVAKTQKGYHQKTRNSRVSFPNPSRKRNTPNLLNRIILIVSLFCWTYHPRSWMIVSSL